MQKVLNLLGRNGHAEGTGGQRAEFLVYEYLPGQAKYGTFDVLEMIKRDTGIPPSGYAQRW